MKAESEKKLKELGGLVSKLIIRRTNDLLSKYCKRDLCSLTLSRVLLTMYACLVPVKYEHVVFCRPSNLQLELYRLFIKSPEIQALLRGIDSQPLKAINILKKLCNHPELLDLPSDLRGSDHLIPEGFSGAGASARDRGRNQDVHCEWSGKFLVLERYTSLFHAYMRPPVNTR